ncbi:MAG: hypothetical protein OQK82_00930 [Candidatus Pacearchaeota archaeon]|nr:hypothetical protein [Candidatus Pacearchaeota archaeon]
MGKNKLYQSMRKCGNVYSDKPSSDKKYWENKLYINSAVEEYLRDGGTIKELRVDSESKLVPWGDFVKSNDSKEERRRRKNIRSINDKAKEDDFCGEGVDSYSEDISDFGI